MLISTALTTGQVTFILRVAIQILSAGGLFLVGLIILGNAPRIASITTHDLLSRISSKESVTSTSLKWLLFRRWTTNDPTSTSKLALGVFIMLSFSLFAKLSDIGLIGLYACNTSDISFRDNPASVSNDDTARALVNSNILNGSDPASIKYFRCEAAHTIQLNANDTLDACTQWTNSTYADKTAFGGLNRSDTAVLMPRQFGKFRHGRSDVFDLNGYYYGPLFRRILKPTIMNGIIVVPHETGVRAFIGVPNLPPYTRVSLPQTLAVESDIGCMTVGMYTEKDINMLSTTFSRDLFQTDESRPFRKYVGPDYLEREVSRTVDQVREYFKPMWNMSTLSDNGIVVGINDSSTPTTPAASVRSYFLPSRPNDVGFSANVDAHSAIFGNCSERLESQLNVSTPHRRTSQDENSCGFLGFGGSLVTEGILVAAMSKVVCATATQVNLVDAEVEVDGNGNITVSYQRVPSDLNTIVADYWDAIPDGEDTRFNTWDAIHRYTLSPNPNGPTQHFIRPRQARIYYTMGAGSGGGAIPRLGGIMLNSGGTLDLDDQFRGLAFLEDEYDVVDFGLTSARVAKWAGQMGASYLLGSTAYNGWAANAMANEPVTVVSTGGKQATCYKPPYAIAFVPLILIALVVLVMTIDMLFSSKLFKAGRMEKNYGGLQTYVDTVLPNSVQNQTLLVWEQEGDPRLVPVQNGQPIQVKGDGSAVEHLHMGKE